MNGHSETDVLVIGAGAGGAAVGKRLSDAGIAVVCLEVASPFRTAWRRV